MYQKFLPLLSLIAILAFSCGQDKPKQSNEGAALMTGNPAIDNLTKQIMDAPNNPTLYAARGKAYFDIQDFQQAILNYEKALSLDSLKPEVYSMLADAYLENVQSRRALDILEKAHRVLPNDRGTALSLAELQIILMQYDGAKNTLTKLFANDKYDPDALFLQGLWYKDQGDNNNALGAFQKTTEYDSDHVDAYIQLGLLAKDKPIALSYFDNAIRIDSNNYDALMGKAQFFHQAKIWEAALQVYKIMTYKYPQEADIQYNTALLMIEKGDKDEAIKYLDLAVKIDPQFANAYYYRGTVKETKRQKEAAIADYRQALAFDPELKAALEALNKLGVKI